MWYGVGDLGCSRVAPSGTNTHDHESGDYSNNRSAKYGCSVQETVGHYCTCTVTVVIFVINGANLLCVFHLNFMGLPHVYRSDTMISNGVFDGWKVFEKF